MNLWSGSLEYISFHVISLNDCFDIFGICTYGNFLFFSEIKGRARLHRDLIFIIKTNANVYSCYFLNNADAL